MSTKTIKKGQGAKMIGASRGAPKKEIPVNLKPCPNCGSDRLYPPTKDAVFANCRECAFVGPRPDPDGKWWNAMARDGEVPQAPAPAAYVATRRDEFAKAAFGNLCRSAAADYSEGRCNAAIVNRACTLADMMIARLDATAGPIPHPGENPGDSRRS